MILASDLHSEDLGKGSLKNLSFDGIRIRTNLIP